MYVHTYTVGEQGNTGSKGTGIKKHKQAHNDSKLPVNNNNTLSCDLSLTDTTSDSTLSCHGDGSDATSDVKQQYQRTKKTRKRSLPSIKISECDDGNTKQSKLHDSTKGLEDSSVNKVKTM